jgi:hypothetical protein
VAAGKINTGFHVRRNSEEQLRDVGKALSGEARRLPEVDPSKPAGLLLGGPPEAGTRATPLTSHGERPGTRRVDKGIAAVKPGEPGGAVERDPTLPSRPVKAVRRYDRQRVVFFLVQRHRCNLR